MGQERHMDSGEGYFSKRFHDQLVKHTAKELLWKAHIKGNKRLWLYEMRGSTLPNSESTYIYNRRTEQIYAEERRKFRRACDKYFANPPATNPC